MRRELLQRAKARFRRAASFCSVQKPVSDVPRAFAACKIPFPTCRELLQRAKPRFRRAASFCSVQKPVSGLPRAFAACKIARRAGIGQLQSEKRHGFMRNGLKNRHLCRFGRNRSKTGF